MPVVVLMPTGTRQAEGLGLVVDIAERRTRADCGPSEPTGSTRTSRSPREVDHQAVVDRALSGDVVAGAPDREEQACSRANFRLWITSAVPAHRAMSAGRRSIIAFQSARVAS